MTTLQVSEQLNLEGIHASLNKMPESAYRTYCNWILTQSNLTEEWLQLVGMTGLTRLTLGLLDGLLSKPELDTLLPFSVPINVFSMYEVMVDNLAIGLAFHAPHDTTFHNRRQVVQTANTAIIERLRGGKKAAVFAALADLNALDQLSSFENSLNPQKHRAIADVFCKLHPSVDPHSIEYAMYSILVANVEACCEVVKTLDGYLTQELVQKGFVRRFAGLNRLLDDTYIARNYLLQIGANTIMVRPMLGYYIAVIAEEIRLIPNYEAVVDNGLLLRALEDASLLVRLLNDLGTALLEQSALEHLALCARLRSVQASGQFDSFRDLILYITESDAPDSTLTRLHKDVRYGEFNVALYEPLRCVNVSAAIDAFSEQLCFLVQVYRERWQRLSETLDVITFETHSSLIADIILRFIRFHEAMYRASSDTPEGEYAV